MTEQTSFAVQQSVGIRVQPCGGIRSILFHVQNSGNLDLRLQSALAVARACGAHLGFLQVTPVEAYMAVDSFGGMFVMDEIVRSIENDKVQLRAAIEQKLQSEDISWDYKEVVGTISAQLVSHAALADLLVTSRDPQRTDSLGSTVGLLGDLLHRSRTPLFIPPDCEDVVDPTGPALIAWDGSYEACNAVRASIGLLQVASTVRVLTVAEPSKSERFPGTKLLEYLSRHDIHAELTVETLDHATAEEVAAVLLARADLDGGSLVVMGGYGHHRIGEYFFGGVTRTLLSACRLPLVIAH
jgi:nucleotide-binding universal stress UspA family protein